jgi:hypothetical protein
METPPNLAIVAPACLTPTKFFPTANESWASEMPG